MLNSALLALLTACGGGGADSPEASVARTEVPFALQPASDRTGHAADGTLDLQPHELVNAAPLAWRAVDAPYLTAAAAASSDRVAVLGLGGSSAEAPTVATSWSTAGAPSTADATTSPHSTEMLDQSDTSDEARARGNVATEEQWQDNPAASAPETFPPASLGAPRNSLTSTAQAGCSDSLADFIDETMWAYRRLIPKDCAVVRDNPVAFSWTQPSNRRLSVPWTLTLQSASGAPMGAFQTMSPRWTLPAPLANGNYRWRVSYQTADNEAVTSDWRHFSVDATTDLVTLPSAADLLKALKSRPTPRLLPQGMSWQSVSAAASAGEYKAAFSMLPRIADNTMKLAIPISPDSRAADSFTSASERAKWLLGLMQIASKEQTNIETLAYAWRLTGNAKYVNAARQRLLAFAGWDPAGASHEGVQPQANRGIYLALAIGYDLLESELSAAERAKIAAAFNARIKAAVAATQRLDREPYAAFENSTIHTATEALLLVAGRARFEQATPLLESMWDLVRAQFQSKGDADGSNAGGTAYSWFDFVQQTRMVAATLVTANVDLTQLSFVRRMGDFLIASTTPDATLTASFGDGLEVSNLYQSYSYDAYRLYARLTGQPQHEWYWRQRAQNVGLLGHISPLHYSVAAIKTRATAPAAPTKADWVFEDTGIVSFNSGNDSQRTSLQFRSSPFGSYNHAHADQNSFTLSSKGADLLISSGYYPYYLSPHHASVTRATRYKNAVTFDGGIGQAEASPRPTTPTKPISSMEPRGVLLQSYSHGPVAYATGDATLAYRGWDARTATWSPLLTNAVRSVSYLKDQGIVLVYDWLTSDKPRSWEWNYHARVPFTLSGSRLKIVNGAASACIEHFAPGSVPGNVVTSEGFSVAPGGNYSTQYHAVYKAASPSSSTAMLTLIRLDCNTTPVSITWSDSTVDVSVGQDTQRLLFNRRTVFARSALT